MRLAKELYNYLLKKAIEKYKSDGKMLSKFDMNKHITEFKKLHPEYNDIHSQVLQNVSDRLSKAFSNFFRRFQRKKTGERIKAGFPRFKSYVKSLTYPQSGFAFDPDSDLSGSGKKKGRKLKLSKVGSIPIILHRQFEGSVKTLTIKRTQSEKWFAIFCCEIELGKRDEEGECHKSHTTSADMTAKGIGIDVGVENFATLSNGEVIENPRFITKSEKRLKKLQRRLSRKKKNSANRTKARLRVARLHERISNQRNDFLYKLSRRLTDSYDFIAVEKLNISDMLHDHRSHHSHNLAKHISDASWNSFIEMLTYKAESAGKSVVCVDPKGTSQICSRCGQKVEKTLEVRIHSCPSCGLKLSRDHNAAINILKKALALAESKAVHRISTAGLAGSNACGDQASTLSQDRASMVKEAGTICSV
jgi:putative transposase